MALEKFHFEASDGTKIDVPFMMDAVSYKQMRKLGKQYKDDQGELGDATLEAALAPDELEKVENLTMRDFNRFMGEWAQDGDASLGKSSK